MKSELLKIKDLVSNEVNKKIGLRFNLENNEIHFKGDNFLRFRGRSQGVEFSLSFDIMPNNRKSEAYFCLGDYRSDGNQYFSKRINFSISKSEKAILKDILERLDIGSINERISLIVSRRKEIQDRKDIEEAKTALLRKALPNLMKYSNQYRAILDNKKNGRVRFLISEFKTDVEITSNNADFIMRVCAAAARIYDEMAK